MLSAAPTRWRSAFLLGALVLVTSCLRHDPAVGNCSALRRAYLSEDRLGETLERFDTYDLETRYRIYICAVQSLHPPLALMTVRFAEGGEEAGHFLAHKLELTTYDLTIFDIVVAFAMMQTNRTFDASLDAALMSLIERKVSLLEGSRREWAERYLQTIRSGPGAPLPVPER